MENKHKGIILSDPKERYMELDRSYLLNYIKGSVIHKFDDKKYIDKEIKDKKVLKKKIDVKYSFGDILSCYGTKEKFIFICKRNRFVYTCPIGSEENFVGMKRLNDENIIEKYDELTKEQKYKLLLKLDRALEIGKFIPKKALDDISRLVLKLKNK